MKRIISTCLSFLMLNSVMISTSLAIDPPFSQAEDQKLTNLVREYGESNWNLIASLMGSRTTRQCRERWKNCLSCPEISKPFTKEEDNLLKQKYQEIGPRWSEMSKFFKDRSDVQLKNRYNSFKKENEVIPQITDAPTIEEDFDDFWSNFNSDDFPSYHIPEIFENEFSFLDINTLVVEEDLYNFPSYNAAFNGILDRYCNSNISKEEIFQLCDDATKVLKKDHSLLKIYGPTIVVGDLHGDIKALEYCCRKYFFDGIRKGQNILFLGDYVDRGKNGVRVTALLFKLKTMFPYSVFLLRGNHEEIDLHRKYEFSKECLKKYGHDGNNVLERINNTFNYLSLAAVVNNSTFCVHGGISPESFNINEINNIKKPYSVYDNQLVVDLLWSDPDPLIEGFCLNEERKIGKKYGANVTEDFLKKNSLNRIIRAHQATEEDGYEDVFKNGSVITISSLPGYVITDGCVRPAHCDTHWIGCLHGYKYNDAEGRWDIYEGGQAYCFTHKYPIKPGCQRGINSGAVALITGNANDDIKYEIYTRELPDNLLESWQFEE